MSEYDEVKKDYLYLESLDIDADYVDIDSDVFDLMANPTKRRATQMYREAIALWFGGFRNSQIEDDRVEEIRSNYL